MVMTPTAAISSSSTSSASDPTFGRRTGDRSPSIGYPLGIFDVTTNRTRHIPYEPLTGPVGLASAARESRRWMRRSDDGEPEQRLTQEHRGLSGPASLKRRVASHRSSATDSQLDEPPQLTRVGGFSLLRELGTPQRPAEPERLRCRRAQRVSCVAPRCVRPHRRRERRHAGTTSTRWSRSRQAGAFVRNGQQLVPAIASADPRRGRHRICRGAPTLPAHTRTVSPLDT